jgi:ADP-ribosylglycohydrolase
MQIRISGRVDACQCSFTPGGRPVLKLEMQDDAGQTARVTHPYPDASLSSQFAAKALASRLRGQHIELPLTNVRFRANRIEAVAPVIQPLATNRKDIE